MSVSREEAEKKAEILGAFYIEVSALNNDGINALINLLLTKIPKSNKEI